MTKLREKVEGKKSNQRDNDRLEWNTVVNRHWKIIKNKINKIKYTEPSNEKSKQIF